MKQEKKTKSFQFINYQILNKFNYDSKSDSLVALKSSWTALVIFFIFLITESLLGKFFRSPEPKLNCCLSIDFCKWVLALLRPLCSSNCCCCWWMICCCCCRCKWWCGLMNDPSKINCRIRTSPIKKCKKKCTYLPDCRESWTEVRWIWPAECPAWTAYAFRCCYYSAWASKATETGPSFVIRFSLANWVY